MKDCKKFRELILTDYTDMQLDERGKKEVEAHISSCAACRRLSQELNFLVSPIRGARKEELPKELWPLVKEKAGLEEEVLDKRDAGRLLEGVLDWLFSPFFFRRLAPVLASVVFLVLAGFFSFYRHELLTTRDAQQGSYLVSMFSQSPVQSDTPGLGFGTDVEEYFL